MRKRSPNPATVTLFLLILSLSTVTASAAPVRSGPVEARLVSERTGISPGGAFTVGLLISLVSNCFYVGTWEFINYKFFPNFAQDYATQMIAHAKSSGATPEKIAEITRQAEQFAHNYHNPLYNMGMTFLEPFPVFLIITLVSAAILKKKSATAATDSEGIRQVA